MTLKEFFEQNGNKPIEIREDGTIRILEEKGPWKPEYGERYYAISDDGKRRALQLSTYGLRLKQTVVVQSRV